MEAHEMMIVKIRGLADYELNPFALYEIETP